MTNSTRSIDKNALRALVITIAMLGLNAGSALAKQKPAAPVAAASPMPEMEPAYVIGAEDLLDINVWREPEITRTVPVRPDGRISLPLIGEVQAAGLTPMQLQAKVTEALKAYIQNPSVTVIVHEIRSQKFNIIGQVERPGSYPLFKPMTVLDALASAGGFRDFAKLNKIYVLRTGPDGVQTHLKFDYKKVVKGGAQGNSNFPLESHDTIVVP